MLGFLRYRKSDRTFLMEILATSRETLMRINEMKQETQDLIDAVGKLTNAVDAHVEEVTTLTAELKAASDDGDAAAVEDAVAKINASVSKLSGVSQDTSTAVTPPAGDPAPTDTTSTDAPAGDTDPAPADGTAAG